jgi:hypothetical protein
MFRRRKRPQVPFEYSELLNPEAYLLQKYPQQRELSQLSKYHRNDIFRIIESCGIPVTQFKLDAFITQHPNMWHDYDHPVKCQVTVIRYPRTGAIFCIRPEPTNSYSEQEFEIREDSVKGTTAEELFRVPIPVPRTFKWKDVKDHLVTWVGMIGAQLNAVAVHESAPDLWETLYRARDYTAKPEENPANLPPIAERESDGNTPFTSAEQRQVSDQVRQIKQYVEDTYNLSSEQISHIEVVLDRLEKTSRRMGRKDWLNLFYATVAGLITQGFIPPQAEQRIIQLAIYGLGHLFGFGGPPPHLPHG